MQRVRGKLKEPTKRKNMKTSVNNIQKELGHDTTIDVLNIPKRDKNYLFTINEHSKIEIHQGSENLYVTIEVFTEELYPKKKKEIYLFSKENKKELAKYVSSLVLNFHTS